MHTLASLYTFDGYVFSLTVLVNKIMQTCMLFTNLSKTLKCLLGSPGEFLDGTWSLITTDLERFFRPPLAIILSLPLR